MGFLQYTWLFCALGMLLVRLWVVPLLMAERKEPGILPFILSFSGMIVFEITIIVVIIAGLLWPQPRPEWVGIVLVLLLSAGYLSAELSALRLNLFFLRIFSARSRGVVHPADPAATGPLPDIPPPEQT